MVDETPVVTGLVAVGDAHICTNPLDGRGCSTGMWQADLLARAADDHGEDATSLAVAYDAVGRRAGRALVSVVGRLRPIGPPRPRTGEGHRRRRGRPEESGEEMKRSILREGLSPATRTDAVVWRAFCRTMNLLAPPTRSPRPRCRRPRDEGLAGRANRPPEPPLGRPREEMLAAVGVA